MKLDRILRTDDLPAEVIYLCHSDYSEQGERFIEKHILGYVASGLVEVVAGTPKTVFRQGDFMYIRKNQLVRYAKISIDPEGFSVICIYLEDAILRSIGAERVNKADHVVDNPLVVTLPVCELLRTYAASLAPYPDSKLMSNQALTDLKILEGIHLLLELHPAWQRPYSISAHPARSIWRLI
jgi:hypothetical protein